MSAHVGFVSQLVYPHDYETRLTKAADTLLRAGHCVTVFSKGTGDETRDGMSIRRLDAHTLPFNPRWFFWLSEMFRREQIDLAIARNLRLASATIVAARRAGIPVVLDLSENQPALAVALGKQHIGHHLTRNSALVGWLERWCVRRAREVWVVADTNRQRLAAIVKNGTRIRLIRNMPDVSEAATPRRKPAGEPLRLIYLGILDNVRGLDMVLQALARSPEVQLTLVGDGPERPALESLARALGVAARVTFRGWMGGPARLEALWTADVGLIPHRVSYFTQTTEPNKLFDYMLCALPVLSTPLAPVATVINAERCGMIADPSPEAWAAAITALAADRDASASMGARGRRAVLERYNWERESRQVLDAVAALT